MIQEGSSTLTIKDVKTVVNDIENLLSEIFTMDSNLHDKIEANLTESDKFIIKKFLNGTLPQDPELLSEKLTEVLKKIKNLPRVRVTVPFEPTGKMISEIINFIDSLSGDDLSILEIVIKPEILAGMKLEYRGIFRDYSVGSKVEELLFSTEL